MTIQLAKQQPTESSSPAPETPCVPFDDRALKTALVAKLPPRPEEWPTITAGKRSELVELFKKGRCLEPSTSVSLSANRVISSAGDDLATERMTFTIRNRAGEIRPVDIDRVLVAGQDFGGAAAEYLGRVKSAVQQSAGLMRDVIQNHRDTFNKLDSGATPTGKEETALGLDLVRALPLRNALTMERVQSPSAPSTLFTFKDKASGIPIAIVSRTGDTATVELLINKLPVELRDTPDRPKRGNDTADT